MEMVAEGEQMSESERREYIYKGYWIKPVYKYLWCVYEDGGSAKDGGHGRSGTIYPDKKISKNFMTVDACKEFIDEIKKNQEEWKNGRSNKI